MSFPRPRHAPGRPLTLAQKRALVGLVSLCEPLGSEADAQGVARASGLKPNAAVLALEGLVRRRLVVGHEDGEGAMWSPTLAGRGLARYVRASEPRTGQAAKAQKSGF